MKAFLAAIQFLTVIPVRIPLQERDLERAPAWFPSVGLIIGAVVMLADFALEAAGLSGLLLSLLSIGALAALTGGLHLDGLADTADGFLSARPRERALEIMRDSHIGAMGVLALFFILAIKVAALAELEGVARQKALLLAPLAGRCTLPLVMFYLPYTRKGGGRAEIFLRRNRLAFAIGAGIWLLGSVGILIGVHSGIVTLAGILTMTGLFSLWSLNRSGGFTGDTLGATSELVEATVLVVASLTPK